MNTKGFTLIELLGVILIISLLVIIVLPRITNSVNNFSTKTDKLMMNMIKDAAKLYVEDNLNEYEKENGRNYCVSISRLINEGYLKEFNNSHNLGNISSMKVTYNNGFEYSFASAQECYSLANYIKSLYKETKTTTVNNIEYGLDETHSLMNDRLGSKDVPKTDGNIRYYGANPNNYIDIGDRDSEGNIIFWRIIGLFKDIEVTDEDGNVIKTEDLVKIIRADRLIVNNNNFFAWDCKYDGTTMSYSNVWKTATLNNLLNNAYYNSNTTNYYFYYQADNDPALRTYNFSSVGLSSKVHNKIERVKWNLGGHNSADVYANNMYGYERGGTNTWSGEVALMYPSDYGYSVDLSSCQAMLSSYDTLTCIETNWMYDSEKYQWALTPHSWNNHQAFYATTKGIINYNSQVTTAYGVRPVLYLNSDVAIVEEKETNNGLKYFVVQ